MPETPHGYFGPVQISGTLTAQDREAIWRQTECSVSFTEYLNMMVNQRTDEPTPESLLDAFELFDKEGLGRISEAHFKKIMQAPTFSSFIVNFNRLTDGNKSIGVGGG